MTSRPVASLAPAATAVVVMGPSGTGKSTIGPRLAETLGWTFAEGDDHHPVGNVQKMAAGVPLDDADRLPWLQQLRRDVIEQKMAAGDGGVVLACSALRASYRDVLRGGKRSDVFFVELSGCMALVEQRLQGRQHAYMPPSLLASQYDTFEPLELEVETGMRVSIALELDEIVRVVVAELRQRRLICG
ncbi:carbohydrate kinase, thermoresistant glucokinase [Trypanosoma grayi]|uniref:carbohydrate kinase, thermoresistant glucokinase n=1 Tax=Trypanosoma grayi TaxID=71804 RepID=UPI0004F422D9|nr:carbohydrate kinase, thermoresistant glucokinase [Trypanosoma grayi]KEG14551.1 carbohydrate kinase, thermoresistant glucokinase [Trypanosoma grayi]